MHGLDGTFDLETEGCREKSKIKLCLNFYEENALSLKHEGVSTKIPENNSVWGIFSVQMTIVLCIFYTVILYSSKFFDQLMLLSCVTQVR